MENPVYLLNLTVLSVQIVTKVVMETSAGALGIQVYVSLLQFPAWVMAAWVCWASKSYHWTIRVAEVLWCVRVANICMEWTIESFCTFTSSAPPCSPRMCLCWERGSVWWLPQRRCPPRPTQQLSLDSLCSLQHTSLKDYLCVYLKAFFTRACAHM